VASKALSHACAFAILASAGAHAADTGHFQRPLRIIVPFAPGGGQDNAARLMASKLGELVQQQVIIDNRPSASGIVAAETLLKAPADGHTMYLASTSFVVSPSLMKSLPYDTVRDFAPITRVASAPGTLVVHASLPVTTARDLVRLAKSKPGQITFASAGVASNSHLSGELFKVLAGVDIIHVPYKGSALASTALISGEVVMGFSNASATLPHVRAGRLRMLGVTTAKRSPLLPDVPTIAESGVPGFENTIWNGVVVSSATPKAAAAALHEALTRVLQAPDVKERFAREGATTYTADTPQEYGAFIRSEIEKWRKIVVSAGIKPQ
jgi:tripartite-type tricarboxylate transporter receptor subunit TctC